MRLKISLSLLLCLLIVFGSTALYADLLLTPTRIIFEPRERSKTMVLKNTSTQPKSYRVFFKNLQMDEFGIYHEKEPTESENLAAPYVRYSPRLIKINPGQTQTIRLIARRKADMGLSEYRSHLAFKEIPPEDFGNVIGADEQVENTVRVVTLFEITIPVILKTGPDNYSVAIDGLKLIKEDNVTKLRVVLNREGDTSAYGDIEVKYKREEADTPQTVGQINRLFIFYPSNKRQIDITLELPDGITLDEGILQVYYNQLQKKGGDHIAFSTLNLN